MLNAFQEYTVTLTGGFAFYGLTCMLFVTIYGCYEIGRSLRNVIRK